MKRLLFMRHGQSTANEAKVYAGSRTDIELTALGRQQAELAGQDLVTMGVEVIIASPLDRAQETAKIVAGVINYPDKLIVTDARLHEIDVGKLTGTTDHGFVLGYKYLADGSDATAETPDEIIERVKSFIIDVLPRYTDEVVLIVAHAGIARAFQAIEQRVSLAALTSENVPNAEPFEISLTKLNEAIQ